MRCGRHRHQKHKAPLSYPEEKVIDARIPVVLPLETLVWDGDVSLLLDAHPPLRLGCVGRRVDQVSRSVHPPDPGLVECWTGSPKLPDRCVDLLFRFHDETSRTLECLRGSVSGDTRNELRALAQFRSRETWELGAKYSWRHLVIIFGGGN
jgi:hypothetical protein